MVQLIDKEYTDIQNNTNSNDKRQIPEVLKKYTHMNCKNHEKIYSKF